MIFRTPPAVRITTSRSNTSEPAAVTTVLLNGRVTAVQQRDSEVAEQLRALQEQIAQPTANFTEADPECDLDYVPNQARPMAMEAALSNSFAFGGLNTVLGFRRFG